ncbi:MAG TPA: hypothetical protein GX519_05130, partial [Thermoanaerobacterales bacterium]|nr:hypothetical protein [Thermoanaerobacterales bacterium]
MANSVKMTANHRSNFPYRNQLLKRDENMYQSPMVIERALTKNGEIQLQKRGNDYEIIFNGTFLMATCNGDSEKLLVRWAIEAADSPKA